MNHIANGIDRRGLDEAFLAAEAEKSNLILEAQLLAAQQQPDAAAERFARAAKIEEDLSEHCGVLGLRVKGLVHAFSAASCWARAGDFHTAIVAAEQLLAEQDISPRLRARLQEFAACIRERRSQWAEALALVADGERVNA